MNITLEQAAAEILAKDNIVILTHANPDGDTLGSGFALYYSLRLAGKRSRVECADPLPKRFAFLYDEYRQEDFEPEYVLSVDVASRELMGSLSDKYKTIDLAIDHHKTNTGFAKKVCVCEAAANCENIYNLIAYLKSGIDGKVANCLYTGVATDTGCFKFSNTTPKTHRIAAELMSVGADYEMINQRMFETKTRARIKVEQDFLGRMEFYFGERLAVSEITREMIEKTGADESELDGVSGIPRTIEGVDIGITLREKPDGCKASLRTTSAFDAAAICEHFGGGGHIRAAGCRFDCSVEEAKKQLVQYCGTIIKTGEL